MIAAFMVPHPPLIVPDVGRGGENEITETTKAYEAVARRIAELKPQTVIISSPHSVMYADYFHISPGSGAKGSFADFRAPGVRFDEEYDTGLVEKICEIADVQGFPAGTAGEKKKELDHGTMVPLYFIRKYYSDFKLVRVGLSGLPLPEHYHFGQIINEAAEALGRRVVFVASGDLSHKLQKYGPYGFAKEGPEYDARIMKDCSEAAFDRLFDYREDFLDRAAECGHRSFVIMAGALDGKSVEAKYYSHQDVTGVGYGICGFEVTGPDENRHFLREWLKKQHSMLEAKRAAEDTYVRLARLTVERYVTDRDTPTPQEVLKTLKNGAQPLAKTDADFDTMLKSRAGAFVSIHEHGRLRGCIGTFLPTRDNLAEEIIENAISAATRDPRFDAITPDELPFLEISVDVLGEPEDIDSEKELNPKRYGVIVTKGGRRGLLLPDLEGVDTVEQQISIARQKAGIAPGEKISLKRFEVVRHT